MTMISKKTTFSPSFLEKIKSIFPKKDKTLRREPVYQEAESVEPVDETESLSPKLADYIAGEVSDFKDDLSPFLPVELIAGEIPYVAGMESEMVWNAAAQACATEKVSFTYSVDLMNDKITYLACPSSSLASAPDSWCPLVVALPGNPDFVDKETVYVYEQDASTAALRWSEETQRIQLFIGASRTIIPKIQSMDTNFLTIGQDNPHVIPWKNRQLRTEKLSRATVRALFLSGATLSILLIVILLVNSFSLFFTERKLGKIEQETKMASTKLVEDSYKALHSDIIAHSFRIQQLLDETHKIDGFLSKYELSKGRVVWEALVPTEYAKGKNPNLKGRIVEEDDRADGLVRIKGVK